MPGLEGCTTGPRALVGSTTAKKIALFFPRSFEPAL
jgi:hypothetical protein